MSNTENMDKPEQPGLGSTVGDWANALPKVYQAQMDYQLPMAQAQKSAMEALYPTTAGLQENLAKQATEGMQSGVPDWMKQQYQSNMNAQLGSNAGSPIGADYMSRGLMQQQQDWRQYYQNMAMGVAGRQSLANPSLDYMSGFNPNSAMNFAQQGYQTGANVYGTAAKFNTDANAQTQKYIGMGLDVAGAAAGSFAGMGGHTAAGGMPAMGSGAAIGNASGAGANAGFMNAMGSLRTF